MFWSYLRINIHSFILAFLEGDILLENLGSFHIMNVRFLSFAVNYFHFRSEPLWPIETRCAAIANGFFTVAINRVGTVRWNSSLLQIFACLCCSESNIMCFELVSCTSFPSFSIENLVKHWKTLLQLALFVEHEIPWRFQPVLSSFKRAVMFFCNNN